MLSIETEDMKITVDPLNKFPHIKSARLAEFAGYIPGWVQCWDPDEMSLINHLHDCYLHGGGWQPFEGFTAAENGTLSYPGDPDAYPIVKIERHAHEVIVYEHAWVLVRMPNKSYQICRMD